MYTLVSFLFSMTLILCTILLPSSPAQTRVSFGAKVWYATWNLDISLVPTGTISSDYSAAVLAGPYISVRSGKISGTLSYSTTSKTFDADLKNDGKYYVGFNMNRVLSRDDINAFLNYSVMPEISLFLNVKYLKYKILDAYTYINKSEFRFTQSVDVIGVGGGVQISVPFTGGSPFYSFLSTGAVANSFKDPTSGETGTELLYFVDSGLGYRFLPSNFGIAVGLRVENGKDTKAIVGPTGNIYYTF